jgi:hypothetical protein
MNLPLQQTQGAVPVAPAPVLGHNFAKYSIEDTNDDAHATIFTGESTLVVAHRTSMSIERPHFSASALRTDTLIERIWLVLGEDLQTEITMVMPQSYIDALTEWLSNELESIARDKALAAEIDAAEAAADCSDWS